MVLARPPVCDYWGSARTLLCLQTNASVFGNWVFSKSLEDRPLGQTIHITLILLIHDLHQYPSIASHREFGIINDF